MKEAHSNLGFTYFVASHNFVFMFTTMCFKMNTTHVTVVCVERSDAGDKVRTLYRQSYHNRTQVNEEVYGSDVKGIDMVLIHIDTCIERYRDHQDDETIGIVISLQLSLLPFVIS